MSFQNDPNLQFLYHAMMQLHSVEEFEKFMLDICTVQELKAISQRLVVAKMLNEGRVYSDIVGKTGASTATISRVNRSLNYGNDGYTVVFERMENHEYV